MNKRETASVKKTGFQQCPTNPYNMRTNYKETKYTCKTKHSTRKKKLTAQFLIGRFKI